MSRHTGAAIGGDDDGAAVPQEASMALAFGLGIGFITGMLFGVALMAALAIASDADDEQYGNEV